MDDSALPKAVIVLCGKRKSGKDFVAEQLLDILGKELVSVIRLSAPIKAKYAKDHQLDFEQLMNSTPYKEVHREAMINWSESIRAKDPAYFCRFAIAEASPQGVWLVCDARRQTDMDFFTSQYGNTSSVLTVRVEATWEVRQARGWRFSPKIDDTLSECGLDHYLCNITVNNSSNQEELRQQLQAVAEWVKEKL